MRIRRRLYSSGIWNFEFEEMFQSALETLKTLLEKQETNIEFLGLKRESVVLVEQTSRSSPGPQGCSANEKDDDPLLSPLLRIQGCEASN